MNPRPHQLTSIRVLLGLALLTATADAQYSSAVLADGPVGYYPLGDAPPADDVVYNSGSAGSALNGTHLRVGHQINGALLLEAANKSTFYNGTARTTIPYHAALNPPAAQPFTIEAWIMPTIEGLSNAQAPLFNRHSVNPRQGWVIFQRASASGTPGPDGSGWNFRMYNENGGSTSINLTGGSYNVADWSHVVITWDGGTARLYVNGTLAGQQSGGYVANSDVPFGIGSYSANNAGDNPFTGNVDEVAFYQSALTLTQIQEHYDNATGLGSPGESYTSLVKGDGAVMHLRMDEPTVDRVVAVNQGSLGAAANGLHFPGAVHEVTGALVGDPDPAIHVEAIDKSSDDGGYPTVLPEQPELNSASFSWEGWVKPTAEGRPNAQCVVKNHNPGNDRTGWVIWQRASIAGTQGGDKGWNLRMYKGTTTARTIDIVTGSGPGGYTVGQWQHLAITYNAATQTAAFYVNGAQVSTQVTSAGPYVPNPPGSGIVPGIGGFANGSENPFEGDLDEVAFYDKVLTAPLIAAHYANGISASPLQPYASLIASDGPVAYYRMNEAPKATLPNLGTAGTAADGTLVNVPASITGPNPPIYPGFPGGTPATLFRGKDTYAELKNPAVLNIAGPITLEAWVQPAAAQLNFSNGIICHGVNDDAPDNPNEEIYLRIEDGKYEVGSATGKASVPIPGGDQGAGSWIHLAGTWSGGTWTLYRNGAMIATGADVAGPVTVANANWAIGARGRWKRAFGYPNAPDAASQRAFNGGILEAAIYNKALTGSQILSHFTAGAGSRNLVLTHPAGVITLEWNGGILQQSDDLETWADVVGAFSPHLPNDGLKHFYRLRY